MGNGGGGKEAQKEEDICKLIADSHCTAETNTCKAIIIQLKINVNNKKIQCFGFHKAKIRNWMK